MPSSFTAHNVILDDQTQTFPSAGWTMDQSPHIASLRKLAALVFPDGLKGRRIVDLGCLEGGYTTEFARLGLEAMGIEVRKSNYENCLFIKDHVDLPNLEFVLDDAWNIGRYRPFDVVFCAGLFYHIDRVQAFMEILGRNCRTLLYLDTHFAPESDDSPAVQTYNLSPLTQHDGVPGRWFPEHDLDVKDERLDQLKWASWQNQASFWPTRPGLIHLMKMAGFDLVFESLDYVGADPVTATGPGSYYETNSRTSFVGLKSRSLNVAEKPRRGP